MGWTRAIATFASCAAVLVVLAGPVSADIEIRTKPDAGKNIALDYLEIRKGKSKAYITPSEIDERYNIALYVNAAGRGRNAQRMWVLQRNQKTGKFELAMWDERWWNSKRVRKKYNYIPGHTPPFSWLVSTGMKWPGDPKSGPTSLGVFAIDERKGRTARGWHSRGMIHVMYIDLHYRSGRRSGIAFHGTTPGQYRKLGRIASHGCIRMHQSNALNLLSRIKGWDKVLSEEERWGEVPRFWKRARGGNRYGYVRDGSILREKIEKPITVADASAETAATTDTQTDVIADAIDRLPPVLTKTGYRALTVIFRD